MPKPKRHPQEIEIHEFQYDLPEERIARFPLEVRDQSKLLIYKNGAIQEDSYHHLAQLIPEGSLMLFNQAKVIHARLHFQKATGGKIELFCLAPDSRYADITTAMMEENEVYWQCLLKGAHKWKDDAPLLMEETFIGSDNQPVHIKATAEKVNREGNSFVIHFKWESSDHKTLSFSEFLEFVGEIPIPPYLKREAEASDNATYQTIFAKQEGSVAAPTASLHFTPFILQQFKEKSIDMEQLTLHVGAGTFMPVKSDKMQGHEMHAEWIEIPLHLLQRIAQQIKSGKKSIAIGTTSTRTIESAYWIGVQLLRNEWSEEKEHGIAVTQWYPYEREDEFTDIEAIEALINYLKEKSKDTLITRTQLIIAPGYTFKLINGMVTNFHQPSSTLLLMISALIGEDWKKVYAYALENNFRFLSYGDGSLLWGSTS